MPTGPQWAIMPWLGSTADQTGSADGYAFTIPWQRQQSLELVMLGREPVRGQRRVAGGGGGAASGGRSRL